MFDKLRQAVHNWRAEHQTFDELSRLTDAQLADIGLSRGEIHSVSRQAAHR